VHRKAKIVETQGKRLSNDNKKPVEVKRRGRFKELGEEGLMQRAKDGLEQDKWEKEREKGRRGESQKVGSRLDKTGMLTDRSLGEKKKRITQGREGKGEAKWGTCQKGKGGGG